MFELIIFILIIAFVCELIDSSLGMGYGTILSPFFLMLGYDLLVVVPSILFSQAFAGLIASLFHRKLKNIEFNIKNQQIFLIITILGVLAAICSVFIAINIPSIFMKTYIGILAIIMGLILLAKKTFNFSWRKIQGIGVISAFNKAFSGGGFGPVITSGQMISGSDTKEAVSITTSAEAPICIASFIAYCLLCGIADWMFLILLTIGACLAAPLGSYITKKIKNEKKAKRFIGILVIVLGIFTLLKTWIL